MSLKFCIECGAEISTSAKTCPHCGKNRPTMTRNDKIGGFVVAAAVIAGIVGYLQSRSPSVSDAPATALQSAGVAGAADSAPDDDEHQLPGNAHPERYQRVDLTTHRLMLTDQNTGKKVELASGIQVLEDHALISDPWGNLGWITFDNLTPNNLAFLHDNCPDYILCVARWRFTLLRWRNKDRGAVEMSLDGWSR